MNERPPGSQVAKIILAGARRHICGVDLHATEAETLVLS